MSLTPADLAKILAQPGYGVAEGSLWTPPATQQGAGGAPEPPHGALGAETRLRASTPSPWPSERHFQAAVIAECDRRAVLEPEYGLVCHIPNENSHKQPGVRAGLPDLVCLARGRNSDGGLLFLELKISGGKVRQSQLDMHYRLRMEGHTVAVIWDSVDEVMSAIEGYLRGEP